MAAVTLADVAQKAGVSLATASRALSGGSRQVGPELRERVLEAAAVLQYVPNAHARALVQQGVAMVGVIVHDIGDPYFAEIARGILNVATAAHRLVMICNTYRDAEQELQYLTLLREHRVDGLILAGGGLDDRDYVRAVGAQIDPFVAAGGRVVYIGRHHFAGDAVLPDNVGGARAVGQLLCRLGHREIGVVAGPRQLTTTTDRLQGFLSALGEFDVRIPSDRIIYTDFSREAGAAAATALLDRHPKLTAVFSLNDVMAIGALVELRQRGIRVPEDISLVGFDDINFASDLTPALTTVNVPMAELGERAMTLCLDSENAEVRTEYLPTRLVERASTAAPRALSSRRSRFLR